jgi:ABC-type branched-subunit amino acid transport system ATPase component
MNHRLSSLSIAGYRQIRQVQVEGLGDINLIVGANNAGKTTLLEALRIYAARGAPSLLEELLATHGEQLSAPAGTANEVARRALSSLFHGRSFPQGDGEAISIGSLDGRGLVTIEHAFLREVEEARDIDGTVETLRRLKRVSKAESLVDSDLVEAIEIRSSESNEGGGDSARSIVIPLTDLGLGRRYVTRQRFEDSLDAIPVSEVPFAPLPSDRLAEAWDEIVLTEDEPAVLDALRLLEPQLQGLAFTQTGRTRSIRPGTASRTEERNAVVRMARDTAPVPLRSMGDGMQRVLQLVLSAIQARNGFLLIDEFESGLHYSVQSKVWKLLFDLARKNDMQIFATTHSSDCVKAFAEVAVNHPIRGALLRLDCDRESGASSIAIVAEDGLAALVAADIEVR